MKPKPKRLPTDLEILNAIYNRYYDAFAGYSGSADRASKIYIPIEITQIAKDVAIDADIVFGRLYYHLQPKHGYTKPEGEDRTVKVPFFAFNEIPNEPHCVHFPLLSAVLAPLREEERKHRVGRRTAVIALIVSILSFLFTVAFNLARAPRP